MNAEPTPERRDADAERDDLERHGRGAQSAHDAHDDADAEEMVEDAIEFFSPEAEKPDEDHLVRFPPDSNKEGTRERAQRPLNDDEQS